MARPRRARWTVAVLALAALVLSEPAARADHSHLSAQWGLDAATGGTTPDGSGHGLAGEDVAGSFAPGRFGNALTLANANDGFRAPGTALLEPEHLTVSAWVKATGPLLRDRQIVSKGGGGCAVQSYGLATSASGSLWWNVLLKAPGGEQLQALTPADAVAPEAIWDDRWHAIAGTFDGTTADLWIDGAKVASAPTPEAGATVDYSFPERRLAVGRYAQDLDEAVGRCDPWGFQFTGAIDEVRIYNRALSAEEIAQLHAVDVTAPPALPEAPPGPLAPPSPENETKPEVRSAGEGEYTCEPGTWRNVASPADFSYKWLVVRGNAVEAVADAQTYRPGEAAYGFPHACVVSVPGPTAPVTATSAQVFFTSAGLNALPRAYGNVRIRGIDVFQVVQPNSRAYMFGYNPDRRFSSLCGGGTPTNFIPSIQRGGGCLLGGRDPQAADYLGVTLDRYKPTTAVVYVDVDHGTPTDPDLAYEVEVSATRANGASLGEPVTATVRGPPRTDTPWVREFERNDPEYGVHVPLPSAWTSLGASIRLHARLRFPDRFAYGTSGYGVRQCDDDEPCGDDDAFTLYDVPFSSFPQLLIASLELRRAGQAALPAPSTVLNKAFALFPGGSRMTTIYQGVEDITAATNLTATAVAGPTSVPGTSLFRCNDLDYTATTVNTATRLCRDGAVAAIIEGWIRKNPGRRTVLRGSRVSGTRYDVVMGIHEYPIPSGGNEPGFARGDIRSVTAGEPRTVESTPYFHATARDRPLTAAAHELGHILTAPHASAATDCSPAAGAEPWTEVDRTLTAERGRLQSTKFIQARRTLRGSTIPAVPSRAVVDGPYTRADGSTSNPPLYDLMSYCASGDSADGDGNAWLSARNWNRFARELGELGTRVGLDGRPRPPLAAAARAAIRQAGRGPQAGFAIGVAGPGGGKIMRVMPPDGDDAPPGGVPSSPFRLRSLGAAGEVLLDAGVAVRVSSEAGPEAGGAFSGPVASAAVAVELVRDGTVLDRLQRSRPPTVRLLAPRSGTRVRRGGHLEVRWQASDPDGGDPHATVDFSPDGRTWRTVHEGPSVGRVAIPGRLLAAGRRARVRLSVSDGFAARTVTSRPFRTEGAAPQVRILAPGVGALVRAGDRVVLAGSALDAAGQPLTGRSLTWYAGRERLGTGARLRTRLPAGTTTLKLVARDVDGPGGQATLRVRVESRRLRLVSLRVPAKVSARTRTVTIRISASAASTLRAAGRGFRVSSRRTTLRIPLPARPRVGLLRVRFRLAATDRAVRGTVTGTLSVVRT